jgi:hypothetical protein
VKERREHTNVVLYHPNHVPLKARPIREKTTCSRVSTKVEEELKESETRYKGWFAKRMKLSGKDGNCTNKSFSQSDRENRKERTE